MDIYDPISEALGVSPIDFSKHYLTLHADCYEHWVIKHVPSANKGKPSPLKGRPSPIKGIPKSEEHKRNLSKSQIGKINSPESRAKMSIKNKGRVFSEEHKANLSAAMKRVPSPKKGKVLSEEHKAKIKESWVRRKAKSDATRG
jgi:hypothetical protein